MPLRAGLGGSERGDAAACASSSLLLALLNFPPLELGRPPTITALESTSVSAPSKDPFRDPYEFSRLSAARLASERSRRAAASSGAAVEDFAGAWAGSLLAVGLDGLAGFGFGCRFGDFKMDMVGDANLVAVEGFSGLVKKRS